MNVDRRYTDREGREWSVTLDAPGEVLAVPPELERSGANLPEHQVTIVFTSGDERYSTEYTAFTTLEDLSEDDLAEWLESARQGEGT